MMVCIIICFIVLVIENFIFSNTGISSPRSRSVTGNPLPNPRVISRALFNDNSALDNSITHIVATFGQFLAHDFTSASLASGKFKNE